MNWWKEIWEQRAKDWTNVKLDSNQIPGNPVSENVQANKSYLSLFLRSARIVNVRKGLNRFYGTVHGFTSLPHLSGAAANFNVVTTPQELKNIAANNIDRVIPLTERLLGPIPYRGGDLDIELGLFSIKSTDLADPYISLLEQMSGIAGVSFINAALPFVDPIVQGVNLLTGAQHDTVLEVGISGIFDKLETGYYAVIRAAKGTINTTNLKLDHDYRLVEKNGDPLGDYPYLVYSIESSPQRPDWFSIPELSDSYNKLMDEVVQGKINEVEEALNHFKRTTLTSPDLLFQDAKKIVDKVTEEVKKIFGPTKTGKSSKVNTIPPLETLEI